MSSTVPAEREFGRWSRWKSVLLYASLALNLLVIGIVAATALRHSFAPPRFAEHATIVSFARQLPDERRRVIWEATRAERRSLRPMWAEVRHARAKMRAELTAIPFNEARYRAIHQELLETEIRARKAAHGLFDHVAKVMTPEERRAFAAWQQSSERPWGRRWRSEQPTVSSDYDSAGGDAAVPAGAPAAQPTAQPTR